ncbi:Growth-regulating factor 6 [Nymphaea thermarum]|nr:Growth-regulating factor 6 [Nymphaea thermarum]
MDFTVGLDGLCYFGGSDAGVSEQKSYGSVGCLTKQGRPGGFLDDDPKNLQAGTISSSKMLKRDDPLGSKPMLFQTRPTILRSNSLFPDGHLGFSSATKPDGLLNSHDPLQTASVPSFQSTYSKTSGLNSTSLNGDMHGVLSGVRGPFTPSQWLELEHQALIFKYISAGVPVPPNLLLPIRKALNLTPLSAFPAGSLRPNGFGWGSFHLGFSGNPDPEPGRCRRTDGKKWRCSRDAVADQKYCERHMNRGRHRSRKPVEGQTGQTTAGTGAASASKAVPVAAPSSAASVASSASDSLAITQHQIKTFQPSADPSSTSNFSRFFINKTNLEDRMLNLQHDSLLSSVNLKEKESFLAPKHPFSYQESSRTTGFGLISSDSLLNDAQRNSYLQNKHFGLSSDLSTREHQQAQSLRHFMDDWPKDDIQPERTQLSISIPVASSGFSLSPSSSPNQEKLVLSPLKLAREMDLIPMGLGVGTLNDSTQRQSNWVPVSWETSLGGPLAEVLHSTSTTTPCRERKTASALNLMGQTWDASSPLESSPTGVLQKTAFGSLSNSSAGSSPRAETHKANENGLSDDPLGSTLINSASVMQS